ncbi:MAG: DUF188 domain-containing protein [Lentisphaeria bacterium]
MSFCTSLNICLISTSMTDLRDAGEMTGGPPPITQRDRSEFLQQLDKAIQTVHRKLASFP